jgi:hypothetical protein
MTVCINNQKVVVYVNGVASPVVVQISQVGLQGPRGPSSLDTNTVTLLDGLLKGNGATLEVAEAGVDYATGEQGDLADTALQPGDDIPWEDLVDVPATFPPEAHTHPISDVDGLSEELEDKIAQTFETVNKNLSTSGATLAYSGGLLSSITYQNGVVKTLGYQSGRLTTVTLSGTIPASISTVKTLVYTGSDLTGVTYS